MFVSQRIPRPPKDRHQNPSVPKARDLLWPFLYSSATQGPSPATRAGAWPGEADQDPCHHPRLINVCLSPQVGSVLQASQGLPTPPTPTWHPPGGTPLWPVDTGKSRARPVTSPPGPPDPQVQTRADQPQASLSPWPRVLAPTEDHPCLLGSSPTYSRPTAPRPYTAGTPSTRKSLQKAVCPPLALRGGDRHGPAQGRATAQGRTSTPPAARAQPQTLTSLPTALTTSLSGHNPVPLLMPGHL